MLHVIATPIGNLGDLSPRALEAFKSAAVIACEDTRRTWQLLTHFGIPRPADMFSYRQGNEERITERIVADVRAGKEVALCSDGGYPAISDPGYRVIRTCAQEGIPYEVIPGASAVNVALLMSGLSTSSFTFRGFPPRGPGALRNWFAEDADKEHTLICYESPFRIAATLEAALDALGDREADAARAGAEVQDPGILIQKQGLFDGKLRDNGSVVTGNEHVGGDRQGHVVEVPFP